MDNNRRTFRAQVRDLGLVDDADAPSGIVEVSIPLFEGIDSYGTGWRPGVFDAWLTENRPKVVGWDHDSSRRYGVVTAWERTDQGYRYEARFNLDTPTAREAYSNIRFNLDNGSPDEWSFRFDPEDVEIVDNVTYFVRAKQYEISPVLVGAVNNTATVAARSADPDPKPDADVAVLDPPGDDPAPDPDPAPDGADGGAPDPDPALDQDGDRAPTLGEIGDRLDQLTVAVEAIRAALHIESDDAVPATADGNNESDQDADDAVREALTVLSSFGSK